MYKIRLYLKCMFKWTWRMVTMVFQFLVLCPVPLKLRIGHSLLSAPFLQQWLGKPFPWVVSWFLCFFDEVVSLSCSLPAVNIYAYFCILMEVLGYLFNKQRLHLLIRGYLNGPLCFCFFLTRGRKSLRKRLSTPCYELHGWSWMKHEEGNRAGSWLGTWCCKRHNSDE